MPQREQTNRDDAIASRREFMIEGISAASALAVLAAMPHVAVAKQAGFGFRHGDFEINVVSDGYLSIPGEIFTPNVAPEQQAEILNRLDTHDGIVHTPTNIAVFRNKNDLILFDIGGGHGYQPSDGRFLQNMRAANIDEAAVTKIIFTHAHPDHIAATLAEDGHLRFPNATYFVGAAEWDFWMDPDFFRKMPEARPTAIHSRPAGLTTTLLQLGEKVRCTATQTTSQVLEATTSTSRDSGTRYSGASRTHRYPTRPRSYGPRYCR